jgi:hypothetical protein
VSIEQAIWDWLPARADRRRTTVPPVIAANLGLEPRAVAEALHRMEAGGHAFQSRRGSWHRGIPLPKEDTC